MCNTVALQMNLDLCDNVHLHTQSFVEALKSPWMDWNGPPTSSLLSSHSFLIRTLSGRSWAPSVKGFRPHCAIDAERDLIHQHRHKLCWWYSSCHIMPPEAPFIKTTHTVLWQLFWCVSGVPTSTFVHQPLVKLPLWFQDASTWALNHPQICFQDNICYSTVTYDLDLKTWRTSDGDVPQPVFFSHEYYLDVLWFFLLCGGLCVRGKQHSSSFSAPGGGHEPLAPTGQPVPPQSVGLRARQAGQLPAVTL